MQPKSIEIMRKTIFLLLLAVLLFDSCKEKKEEASKTPIRVETEVVMLGNGDSRQTYVGIVEENGATAVSFTSMGVIKRMLVSEGQMVSRGQLLAEMDASSPTSGVEIAQASTRQANDMVKQAEETYAQAKDAYDRMKVLRENGVIPEIKFVEVETRLHQAETALNTARSGVISAQAAEKIAQKSVSDTRLYAPVSGVIGKRQLDVGETALPSQSVVSILDISTVKVKVSVPEDELKNISAGTPSYIIVEAINSSFNGGRIEKGVQADVVTHTYDLRIAVANPNHKLLPGMVASVQFPSLGSGGSSGIFLPVSVVQKGTGGDHFVWTVDAQNKVHRTPVQVGTTSGNRIAITSGVSVGDRVVVNGYQKLGEGTQVRF